MQSTSAPPWVQLIPLIVVVAVLALRLIRPQRISVTRMWIQPLILVFITAFAIWSSEQMQPTPAWEVVVGLLVGALAGLPFGILRGIHTDVRPTDRPGVMYLGSSWITIVIFVVAFGLRSVVRFLMPRHGALTGAVGDGLLAFAISFIVVSYVMIARKYREEVAGRLASPPAPPEEVPDQGVAGG
jgi:purine-cytosine permease-like protein